MEKLSLLKSLVREEAGRSREDQQFAGALFQDSSYLTFLFSLLDIIIKLSSLMDDVIERLFVHHTVTMGEDILETLGLLQKDEPYQHFAQRIEDNEREMNLASGLSIDHGETLNISGAQSSAIKREKDKEGDNKKSNLQQNSQLTLQQQIHKKATRIKRIKKRSKIKLQAVQYPTKNFLQNFKTAHLDFLKKKFPCDQLKKYSVVSFLQGKKSVSRSLYQQLYRIEEFQDAFEEMFETKYLYRFMMLSRSESKAKKNHERKILVLEEAFRLKCFAKIN